MPALVKSNVGSPAGTSEGLATRRWPCRSKYSRKASRIWLVVNNRDLLQCLVNEPGIVTLLQQISGQFVSPLGGGQVLLTVTADQHPRPLPPHLPQRLVLAL